MREVHTVPATVGEFIELLKNYPQDANLSVFVPDVYDNGSVYSSESFRVKIDFKSVGDWKALDLTFADGHRLPDTD